MSSLCLLNWREKVQLQKPLFVGNFIKPVKKLSSSPLNFFKTGGHLLQGRVPNGPRWDCNTPGVGEQEIYTEV